MKHLKYAAMTSLLGGALAAACTDSGRGMVAAADAAAALDMSGAFERLAEKTPPRVPASGSAPSFVVDAGWPKPLPNNHLYTGEVDTGQRIQKFLRYGEETGCSGTGSADVGLYSLNR